MFVDFLLDIFRENADSDALVWQERVLTYRDLLDRVQHWCGQIESNGVKPGQVIAVEADFSPNATTTSCRRWRFISAYPRGR